jgi:peroxiredoxin
MINQMNFINKRSDSARERADFARAWVFSILVLLLLLLEAGYVRAADVDDPAPGFKLETLDGQQVKYDDIRGNKPLFIVFWATWCPVCKEEVPALKSLYGQFKDRGLEFLAVNVGINDSAKKAARYVDKYGITYPVAFDNGSAVTKKYGVMGTPTIVIVDRGGTIRYFSAAVPTDLGDHFDSLMQ